MRGISTKHIKMVYHCITIGGPVFDSKSTSIVHTHQKNVKLHCMYLTRKPRSNESFTLVSKRHESVSLVIYVTWTLHLALSTYVVPWTLQHGYSQLQVT